MSKEPTPVLSLSQRLALKEKQRREDEVARNQRLDPPSSPDRTSSLDTQSRLDSVRAPATTQSRLDTQSRQDIPARPDVQSRVDSQSSLDLKSSPAPRDAPKARLVVESKAGWMKSPFTLLDNVLPHLEPYTQLVYLRLFRLSYGHSRDWCQVSFPRLGEATKMSSRQAQRCVDKLAALGLIEVRSDSRRGNYYWVAPVPTAESAGADKESRPDTQSRVAHQSRPDRKSSMKDPMKETHESAPAAGAPADVFEVRKIAARVREVHHGQPGYTPERFRADVRTALVGAGRDAEDETIDEAIKGMAL